MMRRAPLALALALSSSACQKASTPATVAPTTPSSADALDAATASLLSCLSRHDYEELEGETADPLTTDLSEEAFSDLAKIVSWWGPLHSQTETETDPSHGGGERTYELQFSKGGPVELRVSISPEGKLVGFRFGGEGYLEAEREVIADEWREFKVYDFAYLDAEGQRLAAGQAISGNRVDYEVTMGGIEAFVGEHHLAFEKIVFDGQGKEVFHEPIEYDTKFAANAEGIPRGVVRGHLEVPGPGKYEMSLKITDRNSTREVDYRQAFEVVAGTGTPKK